MKTLNAVLIVVLSAAVVVLLSSAKGARKGFLASQDVLTAVSNRLVEATASLSEKAGAVETLQVQMNLARMDIAGLSNHLSGARSNLNAALERSQATERELQGRQREKDELSRVLQTREGQTAQLAERVRRLEILLEESRAEAAANVRAAEELGVQLNRSEAACASLRNQWNDPSALRVQLSKLTRSQPQNTNRLSLEESGRLALRPDGTVVVLPP